ncbi:MULTISPECIES: DUF4189 domain-containing protein [Methylobacteriaceae]|uniref:DUF4189 domain-containing protein n=2 Tax=Methylobacteriaceae TaxID=119045 RepID=A0A169QKV1_9HYPH|nr:MULTISPECIES: DUF4189 domain-containing protein [Methylobacteriaceae]MDV2984028.1 DUF4189 domain-containing protein [Methylobacteriaceae bacterium AG10]RUP02553.1 MAG: DUF4189 domain-containing protein [Mycobacterium sp.]MBY0254974.1 DUF4189 domain-containing protein [Methylobacterium organophilum]BAU89054.1 hypothetical protein MPPM_0449 [Methylorubrum populi]GJE28760.1 hypothetical protein LKMONMHP_3634 [Methylobacterium organophilum]
MRPEALRPAAALLLCLATASAGAQDLSAGSLDACRYSCNRACFSNDPAAQPICESRRSDCESTCYSNAWRWQGGGGRPAARSRQGGSFAAMAVDFETGKAGFAWNFPDAVEARQRAMSECIRLAGRTCDGPATVVDGCLAYADGRGRRGHGVFYGNGPNRRAANLAARDNALAYCRSKGAEECRVHEVLCSWGRE